MNEHVLARLIDAVKCGNLPGPEEMIVLDFHEPMSTELLRSRLALAKEIAPGHCIEFRVKGRSVGGTVPNGC